MLSVKPVLKRRLDASVTGSWETRLIANIKLAGNYLALTWFVQEDQCSR